MRLMQHSKAVWLKLIKEAKHDFYQFIFYSSGYLAQDYRRWNTCKHIKLQYTVLLIAAKQLLKIQARRTNELTINELAALNCQG